MRPALSAEDLAVRLAAALGGVAFLAVATRAGQAARLHMALIADICGGSAAPHCAACYVAIGTLLAGLTALTYAAFPRRAKAVGRA